MDLTPESMYHNTTTIPMVFCYRGNMTTSSGTFMGDNPLDFSFPLLLYQIIIIFICTRLVHQVLKNFSVPIVISQIVGGMLLGPTFLGRNKRFEELFFKPQGWEQLNTLAYFAFTLFIFIIGVKTDIGLVLKSGKKSIVLAICGTSLAHLLVLLFATVQSHHIEALFKDSNNLYKIAKHWCMTSYLVLSCALGELNLLTSKLGRLAMTTALVADLMNIVVGAIVQSVFFSKHDDYKIVIYSFIGFVAITTVLVLVAQFFVVRLIRSAPEGRFLDESQLVTILMMALASALATEAAGYHTIGAFIFGLALPGGAPLGVTLVERLDRVVSGIFIPVFVALAGLRMDLASLLLNVQRWGLFQLFLSLSIIGKFVGTIVPCYYFGMHWKDAVILSTIMNFRGIREVDYTSQFQDNTVVDNQEYTIIMLTIIFVGGVTAFLVKYFYHPEDRFVAYKRRTLHHSKPGEELRIISCIHYQYDVAPTLSLLDASYPTPSAPISVYVLHLRDLVGRADTILRPHKLQPKGRTRNINTSASTTDRICNAFGALEKQHAAGAVSIMPFVCVSPYQTMHEDICTLAHEKKAVLVLIPFHKRYSIDGSSETSNPSIMTMNINVLKHAPCSVAVLIDRGVSPMIGLNHQVGMYFLGGPDDREALALATRMTENPSLALTVIRFRESDERKLRNSHIIWQDIEEERIDEDTIDEFVKESVDNQRIIYKEEVVNSGEKLVEVIRETNSLFSLLIVGKREIKDKEKESSSSLIAGLAPWSEYPELGVIGDLLASGDFGCTVPTLVVQQQTMVVNAELDSHEQRSPRLSEDMP